MGFGFGSKKRRIEETRRNRREEKRRKKLDKKNAPIEAQAPIPEPLPIDPEAAAL